jgi:aminoglycoside 3-N-acetyltransferase
MVSELDVYQASLLERYQESNVRRGSVVYWTGNIGRLGLYQGSKTSLLSAHFEALMELVGPSGTIVVPTHSWSLCNNPSGIFDRFNTPSESGMFTEFVRNKPGAIRQDHPYSSCAAFGKMAGFLCEKSGKHAYGPLSPFSRLIEMGAIHLSVGLPATNTIALVHHVEFEMGVPYRYTKEFKQKCLVDGQITTKSFYLYSLYQNIGLVRNRNLVIMNHFRNAFPDDLVRVEVGRSAIESLSFKHFWEATTNLMSENLYVWLDKEPNGVNGSIYPWQL